VGRANFSVSTDFKSLVQGLVQQGQRRFVLDLSECLVMDSTFSGVIAGLSIRLTKVTDQNPGVCLGLYRPNERIRDLLDSLGVLTLFEVFTELPAGETLPVTQLLPSTDPSKQEITRTCLEAHELLMELNPANVNKFKDVARFFAEDLKRMEQGPK
jgi:anti-anti-sigma regulatory factor